MFPSVFPRFPLFFPVFSCFLKLSLFSYVFPCIPVVPCFSRFFPVFLCLALFFYVFPCFPLFPICFSLFSYVFPVILCFPLFFRGKIQNVKTLTEKCRKCCRFDQVGFQWQRKNVDIKQGEKAGYFWRVISYESRYLRRLRPWKHIDRSHLKVFRYSFLQTIPMFFKRLKSDFILVRSPQNFHHWLTMNWSLSKCSFY